MKPTVFLFDIDGTLILTGGAGRRSMQAAFVDVLGESASGVLGFSFAGMTDRAIVRDGIRAAGGKDDDAAIEAVLEAYLARITVEVTRSDSYQILPGVEYVLAQLHGRRAERPMAIGLGTGNVRRGAYTKLARGGLDASFAFGGFGCDAEDRAALLRIGAERGARALEATLEQCRVVVIGDTPKDVAAALAIGAECIGVGTGGFAPDALVMLGARAAFADLAHPSALDVLYT